VGGRGYAETLARYWASLVDVVHEPPLPQDHPMDAQAMLAERAMLDDIFGQLMKDFSYENVYSRVVGSVIYLFAEQQGTLADGTPVKSPLCSRFTVKDGKIVAVALGIDPARNEKLYAAYAALKGLPQPN
jgi:hypothetical protein